MDYLPGAKPPPPIINARHAPHSGLVAGSREKITINISAYFCFVFESFS